MALGSLRPPAPSQAHATSHQADGDRGVHLFVQYDAEAGSGEQSGGVHGSPPTSVSLPLTNRARDTRPLDWQLRSIYSARPCCCPPLRTPALSDRPPHPPWPPNRRSRSRTSRPPTGAAGPPTHCSTTSLAVRRSPDPGCPRPQVVGWHSAPGEASHHPRLAPRARPSPLGSLWPPAGSRPTKGAGRVPRAGAPAGQGGPALGLRAPAIGAAKSRFLVSCTVHKATRGVRPQPGHDAAAWPRCRSRRPRRRQAGGGAGSRLWPSRHWPDWPAVPSSDRPVASLSI